MTDDYANDLLLRRALYQQQRRAQQTRRAREQGAQSPIQPLYYVARSATSGNAILRSSQGNLVAGSEVVTNSQQLSSQRMLAFGNIASQMPASYPQEIAPKKRPQTFEFGQTVYLIEGVYPVEKELPSSCASEAKVAIVFARRPKLFSVLSILYEKINENDPVSCTCPTWNRVGNRCYPVCDASGTYNTREECLSSPQPPWPNPAGQDGNGGYWVLYGGYKQGTGGRAGRYTYPQGNWQGGIFYESFLTSNPCSSAGLDFHPHYAPTSFVDARAGDFPRGGNRTFYWTYFSLPLIPRPLGGFLADMKNVGSTSGIYEVTSDGWFLLIDYNVDVFLTQEGRWLSGDDIAYGICLVGKYVPAGSAGENPPSPPPAFYRNVGGEAWTISTAGVTLLQNRSALICSPFNGNASNCQDPGIGNPAIACPYPEERRSRTFYLGGSKEGGLEIHKLNFKEPYAAYLVTTEAQLITDAQNQATIKSKEIVQVLNGKNRDGSWCGINTIKVDGGSINKTLTRNPTLPPAEESDWKRSLLGYQSIYPSSAPLSGEGFVNNYRYSTNKNIQSVVGENNDTINFLTDFDPEQKVESAADYKVFEPFIEALKNRDIATSRLCISPIEGNYAVQSKERGFVVNKVYKIAASNINIIAYSGWVAGVKKAHESSILDCKALQAVISCNSNWERSPTPCSKGSGKVLKVNSWQNGKTYIIKVILGNSFASGSSGIQVWACYPDGFISPTNRWFVRTLNSNGGELAVKFDTYPGLFFQQRDPSMDNWWKTLCISWNNQTQTVTLESFR